MFPDDMITIGDCRRLKFIVTNSTYVGLKKNYISSVTDTYIHVRNHAKNLEADLANMEYLKNDLKSSTFFFARI